LEVRTLYLENAFAPTAGPPSLGTGACERKEIDRETPILIEASTNSAEWYDQSLFLSYDREKNPWWDMVPGSRERKQ